MAFDPALTGLVLRLFVRAVSSWLRQRARRVGITGALKTGAVTVIQRFDSALGLNVHFHSLFFDGVYARDRRGRVVFHPVPAPTDQEVAAVAERVFRVVAQELESGQDNLASDEPALAVISQASVRRLVATGPRRGLPIRRLGRAARPLERAITGRRCAQVEGLNLHANVRVAANDRAGLETLCRYMGRPPLSADRLTEVSDGNVALRLKRPWSDGTTHLLFSATELIEKLIPVIPRPRAHLTRYHGVLAPASGLEKRCGTSAGRGRGGGQRDIPAGEAGAATGRTAPEPLDTVGGSTQTRFLGRCPRMPALRRPDANPRRCSGP
jgi:hypothetical protein